MGKSNGSIVRRAASVGRPLPKMHVELAEWFFSNQERVISNEEIVKKIKALKKKRPLKNGRDFVSREEFNRLLTQSRTVLETPARRCTIVWLRDQGYRCGDKNDLALYTAKWVKRTLHMADRTTRLANIVDRDRMPEALQKVFLENRPRIKELGTHGRRFIEAMTSYMKESKRKQLEANKNGKA